jgi:transcriptional regulator with XRE-family HTH domain
MSSRSRRLSKDEVAQHIGEEIRRRRTERGLSRARLAELARATEERLRKGELGRRNALTSREILRISRVLGLGIDDLFPRQDRNGPVHPLALPEGRALYDLFVGIADPATRAQVAALVKSIADKETVPAF